MLKVEPQCSGHSVRQPSHCYNHIYSLLSPKWSSIYRLICISIKLPANYLSILATDAWPKGDRYKEVPLYSIGCLYCTCVIPRVESTLGNTHEHVHCACISNTSVYMYTENGKAQYMLWCSAQCSVYSTMLCNFF